MIVYLLFKIVNSHQRYMKYQYDLVNKYFDIYCKAHSETYKYALIKKTVNDYNIFILQDRKKIHSLLMSISPIQSSILLLYLFR